MNRIFGVATHGAGFPAAMRAAHHAAWAVAAIAVPRKRPTAASDPSVPGGLA